ncbi:hypothetical protein ACEPPN_016457 [Leptodophora sp. 'Broadleaf-Isolate-01']
MNKGTFRLYGDLWLEDPALHLSSAALSEVLSIQAKLHALEKKVVGDPSFNLEHSWAEFGKEETQHHNRPISQLVKPSGNIQKAPLAIRWNWPSFTTQNINNCTVCDPTNPCINLLIQKGFSNVNSFMFEDYYRRERRGGRDLNPPKLRALHKNFSLSLLQAMSAKVELVLGKENLQYYQKLYGTSLQQFPLWSSSSSVSIHLLYDESNDISRIIVFVPHAEHFFHNWGSDAVRLMDAKCNVVAKLARVPEDQINAAYFEQRARQYSTIQFLLEGSALAENGFGSNALEKPQPNPTGRKANMQTTAAALPISQAEVPLEKPLPEQSHATAVNDVPTVVAKSNQMPESLIADDKEPEASSYVREHAVPGKLVRARDRTALGGLEHHASENDEDNDDDDAEDKASRNAQKESERGVFSGLLKTMMLLEEDGVEFSWDELPSGVKDWLKKSFPGVMSEATLKATALAEWKKPRHKNRKPQSPSPVGIWGSIRYLYYRRLVMRNLTSRWEGHVPYKNGNYNPEGYNDNATRRDLIVKAEKGVTIAVKCNGCGAKGVDDTDVRWWTTDTSVYVQRTRKCTSCGKSRWMIPVDTAMKSIRGDTREMKRPALAADDAPTGKKGVKRPAEITTRTEQTPIKGAVKKARMGYV